MDRKTIFIFFLSIFVFVLNLVSKIISFLFKNDEKRMRSSALHPMFQDGIDNWQAMRKHFKNGEK